MTAESRPRVVLVNRCFVRNDSGRFLIIKRSPTDRHNAGKWEVPGGKVDEAQDLKLAQEREVLEETGYLVDSIDRLVCLETCMITRGPYAGLPYVALFHITRPVGGILKLSDEHTHHAWVSYDEMMGYDLTEEVRKAAIILKQRLL